jgi:glycerol-3-phosphate acyltransferase PlsY
MTSGFPLWIWAAAVAGGYLLGSIPFGFVLTRLAGHGDIRSIGSGNIGATNVLRTGDKGLALATLLLDSVKGAVAALIAQALGGSEVLVMVAGFAAVIGHNFPVWLKFKGGKGVATTVGFVLVIAPWTGLLGIATWVLVAAVFRISSLAALVALALAPVYAFALGYRQESIAILLLSILGWVRHRENLKRLLKGEEPRIGAKTP